MKKILEMLKIYVLNKIRSPVTVSVYLVWIFAFFLFLYFIFKVGGLNFGREQFSPMFVASYLVFIPAYISVFGTLGGLVGDNQRGILKAYRSSRLTKSEYFAAKVSISGLSSLFLAALILVLAYYLTGLSLNIAYVFLAVLMTIVSHSGIAFIIASVSDDTQESRMVVQLFMFVLLIGTPVFYPPTMLPEPLQLVQQLIPLTHSIEIMRAMAQNTLSPALLVQKMSILLGFTAILLGTGYRRFEF